MEDENGVKYYIYDDYYSFSEKSEIKPYYNSKYTNKKVPYIISSYYNGDGFGRNCNNPIKNRKQLSYYDDMKSIYTYYTDEDWKLIESVYMRDLEVDRYTTIKFKKCNFREEYLKTLK